MEKCSDTAYVYKQYNLEHYTVSDLITFSSEELTERHGLFRMSFDDGTTFREGFFLNNKKSGHWIDDREEGRYVNGKKEGEWITKGAKGHVSERMNYRNDLLQDTSFTYDTLGQVSYYEIYHDSVLVNSTRPDSLYMDEEMPRFPGCENSAMDTDAKKECADRALLKYLYSSVKYPKMEMQKGIEGRAIIEFTIGKDGVIKNVKTKRGVSKGIRKACEKVVKDMPRWRPGYKNGEPVDILFTMPVVFRIG